MQKLKILWYKIKARLVSTVVNLFATQSNHDIENTVLLLGSARSGTTFLMESLNASNEYRIIFEPFNPTYTTEWNVYAARHFIDPKNVGSHERKTVDNILRGRIKNNWIDQYNRKIRSDKRLIKSVRANLMLDYFEGEYPELKIIYLYRNPYEVVASRINLNFDPQDVHLVLTHETFIKKYYSDLDIAKLKSTLNTPESCHAALWCFENRYILKSIGTRKITKANYHDIIGKTVQWEKASLVISDKIRRPSVTSSFLRSYTLSKTEIENVGKVLNLFSMEKYDGDPRLNL